MKALEAWLLSYLANALWQVPLVFAFAWLAAHVLRRASAAAEHRIWVAALLLEAMLPACMFPLAPARGLWTFLERLWTSPVVAHGSTISVVTAAGNVQGVFRLPSALLACVAGFYVCSILYFAARLGWNLRKTSAVQRRTIAPPVAMERMADRCRRIFSVCPAQIALSPGIAGPMTVGIRRRAIVFPAAWPVLLSPEDLEAALAHEFAHLARHDFTKNLLYELVAIPVAFHPVLWLTRARVAEAREMLCDAIAADVVEGRDRYARSLLRLACFFVKGASSRTPHAIGIFDANIFERRVIMLTRNRAEPRGVRWIAALALCALLGGAACASALMLHLEISPSEATQNPASAHISGGVMAGNLVSRVNPVYPQAAKKAKISGSVVLRAIIAKDGAIRHLSVISGPAELRQSALTAVRRWTYKPYLLNGTPVEVETNITVNYSLAR